MAACSTSSESFRHGKAAARAGDWDRAVAFYEQAAEQKPENLEYRIALSRARLEASRTHLETARLALETGELDHAIRELELAVDYDPTNQYAKEELAEVKTRRNEAELSEPSRRERRVPLLPEPLIEPSSTDRFDLTFAEDTSLRKVLESLGKLTGVNILFDESFRDRRVRVSLTNVTLEEALQSILLTNGLFYEISGGHTVTVEAPGARREH